MRRALPLLLTGALALGACSDELVSPEASDVEASLAAKGGKKGKNLKAQTGRYVVMGQPGVGVAALSDAVTAAGGTVVRSLDDLDIVIAEASADQAGAVAAAGGVESVAEDVVLQWTPDLRTVQFEGVVPTEVEGLASATEPFSGLQWGPDAVDAPDAWAAGYTGAGVRIAILDGGIFGAHEDLAANIDAGASVSFVPGTAWNEDTGTFWHGTHVAGIAAAAVNGVGVAGIAPDATIVGVKVLHSGSGSFAGIIDGIYYAATPESMGGGGAQVINMSLGVPGGIDTKAKATKKDIKDLMKAIDRATTYAKQQGTIVISSMGNDAIDFRPNDHLAPVPADNQHVVGVSATAPYAWIFGGSDYESPASYSSFGKNDVDLSAPGGDFDLFFDAPTCTVAGIPCYAFDMYLSTSRGSPDPDTGEDSGAYSWAAGTSMASPVVAGIAALVYQAEGVGASPSLVENRIAQGVGFRPSGNDAFYGKGWVNAAGAVGAN